MADSDRVDHCADSSHRTVLLVGWALVPTRSKPHRESVYSDRDLQKTEKQFGRCKSFDTYTPIGPFVYADVKVNDVSLELRQNGKLRQSTRTSRMIYSVAQIISFASQSLTLFPGDIILTGTPAGVGPIHVGDELEATIENWPRLRNTVAIASKSRSPGEK